MRWPIPLRTRAALRRLAAKLYRHLVVNWLPISWVNKLPIIRATQDESWSIGIYHGASPLALGECTAAENPVLDRRHVSDVKARFLADPFIVQHATKWHMFFEVLNMETRKGEIAWAISDDARQWQYQRVVLSEPFHLSYPLVFEWQGSHYMVPESRAAGAVRLYKATAFPTHWQFVATLLAGEHLVDATLFHYQQQWWMFVGANASGRSEMLRLYLANHLLGPWIEHPQSPVVEGNPRIARPAGRVVSLENRLLRFTQDCSTAYGTRVIVFEISELTATTYREEEIKVILEPTGAGWSSGGTHHVDAPRDWERAMDCLRGWKILGTVFVKRQNAHWRLLANDLPRIQEASIVAAKLAGRCHRHKIVYEADFWPNRRRS